MLPFQGAAQGSITIRRLVAAFPTTDALLEGTVKHGASARRASVLECSSPLELWPNATLANRGLMGFFPNVSLCERLAAPAKTTR